MLEKVDLSQKISKTEYKPIIAELEYKLGALQREARKQELPVIILFEGWEAAGKGTLINRLTLALDPRGFNVYSINPPNEEERLKPYLWRFWTKIPEKGRIALFDRSWYGRVLEDRVEKKVKRRVWQVAFSEFTSFEEQLINGDYLILKFFLHISKREQKKRFKKLLSNPATEWRVTDDGQKQHKQYKKFAIAYEDMLAKSDIPEAPWTIVESHDRRLATIKVFKTIIDRIEQKIQELNLRKERERTNKKPPVKLHKLSHSILDRSDLSLSLTRKDYEKDLKDFQGRIREIEHEIYTRRIPVIIIYEGWDASGKGGNIKRLVQRMDPRGYEVVSIIAPNEVEKQHHYLWRFWRKIPKAGHIVIFDRSWYGRVLVERIEGFCTEDEWKRAYKEINETEEHLTNFGTVLIKFWLHIDSEEQLKRFKSRETTQYKQWKINEEDWRNREKWEQYKLAVDEMLFRTSTSYAPWTIVEGNSKPFARIRTLKTVIEALENRL